ncbi:MAG: gamma-glutamyl-gamma-aminobutyrate hydrolase family protein [Thermoguttaceae bacterium]|nr:gamma-glutamyl-gamma-aminobutyrate hydrolase family protein [Thermoguttaceae bacterium]
MRRLTLLLLALFVSTSLYASAAESKLYENEVLYCVSESDGQKTIMYDGFRISPLADDAVIVDETSEGIDSLTKLDSAIGVAPNIEDARLGDTIGDTLGDALYANITLSEERVVQIDVVEHKIRPVVGIAWSAGNEVTSAAKRIALALLRNGAKVRFLKSVSNEEECQSALETLAGLFVPGGEDVNPALYGEEAYPHGSIEWSDARDVSDVLISRWAIKNNLPGLWVCRGEQVLNVALGGGLIQDIPSHLGARVQDGDFSFRDAKPIPDDGAPSIIRGGESSTCVPPHYRVVIKGFVHRPGRHPLGTAEEPGIAADSKFLLPIVGSRYFSSVMTSHHQAINPDRLGEGLTIVAQTPDEIVEAVEYQKNDFALATQFHFEYDTLSDDPEIARFSNAFFKALISAALKR